MWLITNDKWQKEDKGQNDKHGIKPAKWQMTKHISEDENLKTDANKLKEYNGYKIETKDNLLKLSPRLKQSILRKTNDGYEIDKGLKRQKTQT